MKRQPRAALAHRRTASAMESTLSPQQQLIPASFDPVKARRVDEVPVAEEMSDSFLAYALSVITSRAIPDVRDGLKPVQRRVLWSMLQMGVRPGTPYRKCARIVGDTMGRYHPHGDAAIYDALVRMGQTFSRMIPMVDPQGNFGSLDDPPAAARYTECRLTTAAMEMVGELDEDTVDFRPTYDGEDTEPVVLPAALPNLLVNGISGIAVGMATSMLPHNLGEVAAAIELVLKSYPSRGKRRPTTDELMKVVPGPDFASGGIVVVDEALRRAYETGRGSVRVRARTAVRQLTPRRQAIVVTELPHLVGPERVVSKISSLAAAGRLPNVAGVVDLSGVDGLRLQIDLKLDVDAGTALVDLFRLTPLEENLSVNNVVLVDGVPSTVGLRDLCEHFVAHRLEVIVRRTRHRVLRAEKRLEVVEGLLVALDNIDEVVAMLRGSRDARAARSALMTRFDLSERQARHILDMALRRLTALEGKKLATEATELRAEIDEHRGVLASERKQRNILRRELRRLVKEHADARRAEILDPSANGGRRITMRADGGDSPAGAPSSATSQPDEACIVTLSTTGNIGRMPTGGTRRSVLGRHDLIAARTESSTASMVAAVTSAGRCFSMSAGELTRATNRIRGAKAAGVFELEPPEQLVGLFSSLSPSQSADSSDSDSAVLVTSEGAVKRIEVATLLDVSAGSQLLPLEEDQQLVAALGVPSEGAEFVIAASDGRAMRMSSSVIRLHNLNRAAVVGMKLVSDACVIGAGVVDDSSVLLQATASGGLKSTNCSEIPARGRGGQGVLVARLAEGDVVVLATVGADTPLLVLRGREDKPHLIDPQPVVVRENPTPRYRAATPGDRRIHALAPARWQWL